jgi:hypothetical protein
MKDSTTAKASASALAATDEDIFNNRLSLIRNLADMQPAIYFCFPNSTWSSQWVGLFGVINAVTGGTPPSTPPCLQLTQRTLSLTHHPPTIQASKSGVVSTRPAEPSTTLLVVPLAQEYPTILYVGLPQANKLLTRSNQGARGWEASVKRRRRRIRMSEFALIFLMGPGCREKRRHGVLSQGVFSVFRGWSSRRPVRRLCCWQGERRRELPGGSYFSPPSSLRSSRHLWAAAS